MNEIREALDTLGLALAEHGHAWTDRERQLYERAVTISSGDCMGTDSLSSEKPPSPKHGRKSLRACVQA